nr:PD40 domain-containing protein [Pyrinomonadaceae bacterium]
NIMVRRDGYVKVLDFGLAKLAERNAEDTEAMTLLKTQPGMIMGTVSYMAPEQARGDEVDARADIWSVGVVLYELLAGKLPFEGPTISHVMVSILENEPPPVTHYSPEVPNELEWIVKKALRKDREARYQTIKELWSDLKTLKQRLEFEIELERSVQPDKRVEARMTADRVNAAVTVAEEPTASTGEVPAAGQASSVGFLVSKLKLHEKITASALALLFIITSALAFKLYGYFNPPIAATAFQKIGMQRLSNTGRAKDAALSPDGRYVVYVLNNAGREELWVRQITAPNNTPILLSAEGYYQGLTFSPNSEHVYFVKSEKTNSIGSLYRVAAAGGEAPKKRMDNIDTPITFSPDGKQFAFVSPGADQSFVLTVANEDGSGRRPLAARKEPEFLLEPSWSPDGKVIACVAGSYNDGFYKNVIEVGVSDGVIKPITARRWWGVERVAWLADGSGLVMAAREQSLANPKQVLLISYPDGEVREITNDLSDYGRVTLTKDSTTLVTVQSDQPSIIWVAPDGDASRAKAISSDTYEKVSGIAWTPDNKIVYASTKSGNSDIWIMNQDGTSPKQLTDKVGNDLDPAVSSDGKYIVFGSNRTGTFNIWRMNIDGGDLQQLTNGHSDWWPNCSPDGRWVVYTSYMAGTPTLWKVPIDGGGPEQLTSKFSMLPVVSPDGQSVAYLYKDLLNSPLKIAVMPFAGGAPTKVLDVSLNTSRPVRWAADGRSLTYVDQYNGVSNIWSLPLEEGSPKRVTNFETDRVFSFAWSRDGRWLAYSRGAVNSHVVLINSVNK